MSRSAIYVANPSPTSVAVGGTIPLGTTIRRFGCNLAQAGNGVTVSGRGYYDVDVSATILPTAAGTVNVALLADGVAVPGATASETVAAAGAAVNLGFPALLRMVNDCETATLTLLLTGVASTVNNVGMVVEKL